MNLTLKVWRQDGPQDKGHLETHQLSGVTGDMSFLEMMDVLMQCNYLPDFHLINGVFLEVKGRLTSEDRRKMKAVKLCNPELDIRFVFQAPYNKIYKGSKTTYAKWAEKHGFPWCSYQTIPIDWLT